MYPHSINELKIIQVNNQKSTDTLLRSFNSRVNSQQGKKRTNFIVKKFQYLQAMSDKAAGIILQLNM